MCLLMRVCFVSQMTYLKGAERERVLLELVLALRSSHVDSFVILPRREVLYDELTRHGIPCAIIKYDPWIESRRSTWHRVKSLLLSSIKVIPMIVQFQKWKIDLVCSNSIAVFSGAFAAWIGRKVHVWFIHESIQEYRLTCFLPRSLTLHLVDIWSNSIILASHTLQEEYSKYFAIKKTNVIYPSVPTTLVRQDLPIMPFKHDTGLKCVSVGTLHSASGYPDVIKAVGYLNRRGYKVRLAIVGDGPDRKDLEALTKLEEVQDKVSFTGFLPSATPVIEQADVVLVCSRKERFRSVKVEAMRLEKPIIAATIEGREELLQHGFNALIYAPGDYEELAQKILLLLQSPALRNELGQNGRRFAEQFSPTVYAATLLEQFKKTMSVR